LKLLQFIVKSLILGLAAAFIAVWVNPELLGAGRPAAAGSAPPVISSYADAVNRSAPAVVSIYTRTTVLPRLPGINDLIFQRHYGLRNARTRQGLGSGVIVEASGYIVTSNHVVDQVDDIMIALWDGRTAPARVVGRDPATDLAVLKIDLGNLPTAPLAAVPPRVGDVVLAIGNALGLNNSVTLGIVSGLGRSDLNIATVEEFIQTDAAINAGNSGGALINANGEIVGINSSTINQRSGAQGIGFAIPVAIARRVLADIIEFGSVRRGWLGAEVSDIQLNNLLRRGGPPQAGVEITEVMPFSPAWENGLQPGDLISHADGAPVGSARALLLKIAESAPGTVLTLTITRNGQPLDVKIKLIQQPPVG